MSASSRSPCSSSANSASRVAGLQGAVCNTSCTRVCHSSVCCTVTATVPRGAGDQLPMSRTMGTSRSPRERGVKHTWGWDAWEHGELGESRIMSGEQVYQSHL